MTEKTDYDLFPKAQTYKIVRTFDRPRYRLVVRRGLTLKQAEDHLKLSISSSETDHSRSGRRLFEKRGHWIDAYEPETPTPSWIREHLRKKGFDV